MRVGHQLDGAVGSERSQNQNTFVVHLWIHPIPIALSEGTKGTVYFSDRSQWLGKRLDLSVEDAICLEKARGRGPIALAIESGCQLASSDNCFPWQDPVGREKESAVWGINTGIHFHRSLVIIVSWARGYLLPICVRAKLWLTPIDQRERGMEGWKALSITMIVTQGEREREMWEWWKGETADKKRGKGGRRESPC